MRLEKFLNCLLSCGIKPERYFKHSKAADKKDIISRETEKELY